MKYKSNLVQLIKFDNYINSAYKNRVLIGIDEVGRGALAGPVIACAFFWKVNPEKINKSNYKKLYKLNDSKQLNSKERNELCKYLKKYGNYSLGYASVQEIEKLKIFKYKFFFFIKKFYKKNFFFFFKI